MDDNLRELSELLREGQKRSRQLSYRRRAPVNAAASYLRQARNGFRLIVEAQPGNAEAWRRYRWPSILAISAGGALMWQPENMR